MGLRRGIFAGVARRMVVCAVVCEPVSTLNSQLSAVLQGNFRKMTGFAKSWSSIVLQFQSVTAKFPGYGSREFFRAGREAAGKAGKALSRSRETANHPADE